jgi:hypothetical protein
VIDPTWIKAGSDIISSLVRTPAAAPATSGGMVSTPTAQDFDFSGFTVATGNARATGAPNYKTTAGVGNGTPASAPASGGGISPGLLVAGLAAVLAFMGND